MRYPTLARQLFNINILLQPTFECTFIVFDVVLNLFSPFHGLEPPLNFWMVLRKVGSDVFPRKNQNQTWLKEKYFSSIISSNSADCWGRSQLRRWLTQILWTWLLQQRSVTWNSENALWVACCHFSMIITQKRHSTRRDTKTFRVSRWTMMTSKISIHQSSALVWHSFKSAPSAEACWGLVLVERRSLGVCFFFSSPWCFWTC